MIEIQVFDGEGIDVEGAYQEMLVVRAEAAENQWNLVDYLDDFNHTIEAHQWHIPPKQMLDYLSSSYDVRKTIVEAYRKVLEQFYEHMQVGTLCPAPTVKLLRECIGQMIDKKSTLSFNAKAEATLTIVEQWGAELRDAGVDGY